MMSANLNQFILIKNTYKLYLEWLKIQKEVIMRGLSFKMGEQFERKVLYKMNSRK